MSALKICPQCGTEYELDQKFCPKDGTTLRMQGGQTGDLVGSIIADRYNVIKKLGEGGMGTVYLAEHVKMGRKSAVKVMNPGMVNDADAISRFNREAANASRINHANVAAVYDFGETTDGLIYLAMEFVEGPSLTKVIEDAGSLPPVRAADITRQAAEALAVAHDMGIVHRDLKPDNIMIAKNRDGSDCVKVVDFGIAKAAGSENQKVTKTGLVVGTPEYMSPEQLAGDKLDGRSDTYSLALVAFAMLTGHLPFPAETVQESMIKRLTDVPKTLAEMKPQIAWPEEVQAVMQKALERDAVDRYQTSSEFGRELYRAVEAMPKAMRMSGATAVIAAPVAGASAKTSAAPARGGSGATKPLPATKVNPATPATPQKAMSTVKASKSKMPMMVGIAAVVVIGAGLAAFKVMGAARDSGAAELQGSRVGDTTTTPAAAIPAPAKNLWRELERIRGLPDTTAAEARIVLGELQQLDTLARAADDSNFLRFRYMRGKAFLASGDKKAGCDSLFSIEGELSRSRLARASGIPLQQCRQ